MAQWYAQVGGQRYGPVGEEEMKGWIAQGRVKPTDFVWSEGMPAWVAAGSALGQPAAANAAGNASGNADLPVGSSSAGNASANADLPIGSSPADAAGAASPLAQQATVNPVPRQPEFMVLAPAGNVPGAVASMVCGIIGTALSLPCCGALSVITGIAGLALGIVALVLARKAKALLAANPDAYTGQGMATAGFVLGIVAISLACLCILIALAYLIFMGTMFTSMFSHGKF